MQKTFLLGVGAQKSGTTWLYDYLYNHTACDMGFAKEYHIFDALHVEECRFNYDLTLKEASEEKNDGLADNAKKRMQFYLNIDTYFDYFHSLLHRERGVLVTGDMTPSYSALPINAYEIIRDGFSDRGVKCKVVFIMRDPVERCISAMRMLFRDRCSDTSAVDEEEELLKLYSTREFEVRTRYDLTINNLEHVFCKEDILYLFYEKMFSNNGVEGVCRFLNIPFQVPNAHMVVNASKTNNIISESTRKLIYRHYLCVYDYVIEKFRECDIDKVWSRF